MKSMMSVVLTLLVLASSACAAPKKTHLVGSLFGPSVSAPEKVVLTVTLSKPIVITDTITPSLTYAIASVPQQIAIADPSSVSFYLAPNQNATPSGTYYIVDIVTKEPNGRYTQKWEIPDTTLDVRIADLSPPDLSTSTHTAGSTICRDYRLGRSVDHERHRQGSASRRC